MDNASAQSLDLSRWREAPRGIGYRRWSIVATGLRQLLRTRFFKFVLSVAWSAGLMIAVAGFVFSQSVADGGWLQDIAVRFGPRTEALFKVLSGLVAMFPGWACLERMDTNSGGFDVFRLLLYFVGHR